MLMYGHCQLMAQTKALLRANVELTNIKGILLFVALNEEKVFPDWQNR